MLLRKLSPCFGILFLLPVSLLAETFSVEVTIDLTDNYFENIGSNVIQITAVEGGVETIISTPAVGTPITFNPFAPGDSVELILRTDTESGETPTPADRGLGRADAAMVVDLFPDASAGQAIDPSLTGFSLFSETEVDSDGADAFSRGQIVTNLLNELGSFEQVDSQFVLSDPLFGDNKNSVDLGTFGDALRASNQVEITGFGSFFGGGSSVKKRIAKKSATNNSEAWESTGYVNSTIRFEFVPTVVPVPAAAWLFGSALGLLGWMRRKAS